MVVPITTARCLSTTKIKKWFIVANLSSKNLEVKFLWEMVIVMKKMMTLARSSSAHRRSNVPPG